ncbi:MAG: hydrogenase maturation protease [Acidobacteriota bacterium]|nr:hydrogenase maturation protease [Acidobacteriota bacterium]
MRTLIIGMGNPILTDDGVGVKVARVLTEHLAGRSQIKIAEACTGGLRIMEMALGYDRVVLIDAICRKGGRPGVFHRMTLADIARMSPTQNMASAHDTSLITALEMGKKLGLELPGEWIIYAVDVDDIHDFSRHLTPEVARAVPRLTQTILDDLGIASAA